MLGLTKKKISLREAIAKCIANRENFASSAWSDIRQFLFHADPAFPDKVESERIVQHEAVLMMVMFDLQYVRTNWSEGVYETALGIVEEKIREFSPHQEFAEFTLEAARIYEYDCRRTIDLMKATAPQGMWRKQFANSFCRRNAIGVSAPGAEEDPGPVATMVVMDLFFGRIPNFFPDLLKEFEVA